MHEARSGDFVFPGQRPGNPLSFIPSTVVTAFVNDISSGRCVVAKNVDMQHTMCCDATMILVGYRHGLRVSELVDLRWDQMEFATATLHVRRVKQGTPSTHPMLGDELRALRRLQREQEPKSPFVFTSERGAPFSTAGFARMVERAGREAKLAFKAHPHMLRHACGYALANKGHDTRALQAYLGHCNIQHTVRYTELSPTRFKDFWRE